MSMLFSIDAENPEENEAAKSLKAEIRVLLQKCKLLARGTKTARPSRCFSCPELSLSPLARDVADKMTRLYVSRFESAFRVLHIPSFWIEYEQYWSNTAAAASALHFKAQLVIAIGSSLY